MKREIEFLPLKTFVFDSADEALESAAREMANWIRTRRYQRSDAILGLSTGDDLEPFYEKMQEMSGIEEKGGLATSGVRPVTLHEIVGGHTLHNWITAHLLEPWGTTAERRIHLDGAGDPTAACESFEEQLKVHNMDLCLVRVGANGRVGWNEPGTDANSRTRMLEPNEEARADFAAVHEGVEPAARVLAPGLATLRGAKRVRLFGFGAACAEAIEAAQLPDPDPAHPMSQFVGHKDFELLLDAEAASALE